VRFVGAGKLKNGHELMRQIALKKKLKREATRGQAP